MFRAIIVDDERIARQAILVRGKWEAHGIEPPREAVCGHDALKLMGSYVPDIVFVDVRMPEMDGLTLLGQAIARFSGMKFVVVSGYDDFEYARRAIRLGVSEYLLKPVSERELDDTITNIISAIGKERQASRTPQTAGAAGTAGASGTAGTAGVGAVGAISKERIVNEIRGYIDENYSSEISLGVFARKYFVSKEYLSRCFKEITGIGIYKYVTKTRMEAARELLRDPGTRINAVAGALGYQDKNYFSRAFYNYYSMYPSEYQKSVVLVPN